MAVSPARAAAFDILLRVEQQDAYASELLHSSRFAKLSPQDHGLTTELVMGVLRWRSLLDTEISSASSQKLEKLDIEVLIALRLAAYQLMFLERVPDRAVVNESVELVKRARKRSAAPFVNAVLRKLADKTSAAKAGPDNQPAATLKRRPTQNRPTPNRPTPNRPTQNHGAGEVQIADAKTEAELSHASAHPRWLVERWTRQFGYEAAKQICIYDQQVPESSMHLHGEDELSGLKVSPGKLLSSARRLQPGTSINVGDPRFNRIHIQDEASQLVALLAGKGSNILDCCAAPGGKTRLLAHRNPGATVVAAELHPHRARLLRRLVPAQNVCVLVADVRMLPITMSFDRVLVDVPCTGTGTLARNPEIKWRLRPADLLEFQERQLSILQSAMQNVAPGGRLVYSTCSLEPEENQDVVERAVSADVSFRINECCAELEKLQLEGELVWKDLGSITSGPYLRTIPGIHPCDGFFAAVLEKRV
jgi:16S rRNA (cytosine967-C5)-methyltransferase